MDWKLSSLQNLITRRWWNGIYRIYEIDDFIEFMELEFNRFTIREWWLEFYNLCMIDFRWLRIYRLRFIPPKRETPKRSKNPGGAKTSMTYSVYYIYPEVHFRPLKTHFPVRKRLLIFGDQMFRVSLGVKTRFASCATNEQGGGEQIRTFVPVGPDPGFRVRTFGGMSKIDPQPPILDIPPKVKQHFWNASAFQK